MNDQKKIIINGNAFSFENGETIRDVASRNSIDIPTLCYLKGASPTGNCRICIVEIEGQKDLLPSCNTLAETGMVVHTESPSVVEARRLIIQLMLSTGNHNCAIRGSGTEDWTQFQLKVQQYDDSSELCPVWGDCRLQDLAYRYQVEPNRFSDAGTQYPLEDVNPFIIRDFSRCIKCGRCVQACNDIQVNNAIKFGYKGEVVKIVAADDKPLKDSDCVFCGECVQVCPVGALVEKDVRYRFRHWETKKTRTTCTYCSVGCQLHLHVKDNRVIKVSGAEDVSPNFGSLCVKGRFGYDFIHSPERLTTPLIKENGRFREAAWDEALETVAQRFVHLKEVYGPDSLGVIASSRMMNEEIFIANKFVRAVLKTNNIDQGDGIWHSPAAGLASAFGSAAMTNTIGDIETADVILVTGSDTTENHPVLSSFIKRAVSFRGARLIVADPRRIKIAAFARHWLRQKVGTDVAWINGMMHIIIHEDLYDKDFVEKRTEGFEALKSAVERYTPTFVEEITGIPQAQLMDAARIYAGAERGSICCGLEMAQHTSGTDSAKSLANLAMLCGHLGVKGGGVNLLQEKNNAQGACDMGGLPEAFSGYQPVTDPAAVRRMEDAWGVSGIPLRPGLTAAGMISKAHAGELKGLYVVGENPLMPCQGPARTGKDSLRLDFLVVQDSFLTATAKLADIVLPSTCFAEKEGTFTNCERRVQRVRKALEAPGQAMDDWRIIAGIANRMGYVMPYENTREIMEEIAAVTPSYAGIDYDRIEYEGIHCPCPSKEHPGTPIMHREQFTSGRGRFQVTDYAEPEEKTDGKYPLYLTAAHVRCHPHAEIAATGMGMMHAHVSECFVEISKEDAKEYGLEDGAVVKVESRRGDIQAAIRISETAVPGSVFLPYCFAGAAAARLTNAALDPVSGIPGYRVWAVRLLSIDP